MAHRAGLTCLVAGSSSFAGDLAVQYAQRLARHSDINLTTNRYGHTLLGDEAAALDTLPRFCDNNRISARLAQMTRPPSAKMSCCPWLPAHGANSLISVHHGAVG